MPDDTKKLVLIDGNSLFYRAFFAMRYLSTSDGLPTNALYGLTTMLLKVLELQPDYVAVAFDTPKPTFRHEQFDGYKAHRPPVPDALAQQAPIARELIGAFNIPAVEVEGYEADDIIAVLARQAENQGIDTLIVTGDLDALQVVGDHVSVMTTVKGVSDTVTYDRAAVLERFGLAPEQMADFKGLKGDPSDNIPGVPGIGDKTAASLLAQYGTVENLLDHVDDLPEGRVKKALKEHAEQALMSKRLATLASELPVELNLEDYRARQPDVDALRDLFVRLEFKTVLQRLPQVQMAEGRPTEEPRPTLEACRVIGSAAELDDLLTSLRNAGRFAFACHTINGKPRRALISGIAFSTGPGDTAYVPVEDPAGHRGTLGLGLEPSFRADLASLAPLLSSEQPAKSCHDLKTNHAALTLRGVDLNGVRLDTMLAAYLLDSSRGAFSIGEIAFEQLSLELPGVTAKKDEELDPVAVVCGEAEAVSRLTPVLEEKLVAGGLSSLLTDIELPLAPILARMELTGVALDVGQLAALSATLEVEIKQVEREIYQLAGEEFNIGSPKQLQTILFDKLGLQTSKKTKTGFSTSAAALELLAVEHPIVAQILHYRELTKIKSTYADALPKLIDPDTGRIHTSLNQAVTATGRLSSSDPNLQNIPVRTPLGRAIRRAFVASADNTLLSADYSQIELRILAHVTGDPGLVAAFENDEDIHLATACTVFRCGPDEVTPEMRRRAKTINFAVIYGMADFTLSRELGIGVREARDYIDTYFARFPGVRAYIQQTIEKARRLGYVSTALGRRRYIPDINAANRNIRLFAERAAVNMPVQGTAADIMKLAMVRVSNDMSSAHLGTKMLLQVHDELLFEVPPGEVETAAALVREAMANAYRLRVPLRVDVKVGPNWSEMKPV